MKISKDYPSKISDKKGIVYSDFTQYEYNPYTSHIKKSKDVLENRINVVIDGEKKFDTKYHSSFLSLINRLYTEIIPVHNAKLDELITKYKNNDISTTVFLNLFVRQFKKYGKTMKGETPLLREALENVKLWEICLVAFILGLAFWLIPIFTGTEIKYLDQIVISFLPTLTFEFIKYIKNN